MYSPDSGRRSDKHLTNNKMDYTKENIENYRKFDNALFWATGTVITRILPYLAMLIGWIAGDCSKPLLSYYTGVADSAAFVYSVSLCLLLLCLDFDKMIATKDRSKYGIISGICVISSALLYGVKTISDLERQIELKTMSSEESTLYFYQQDKNTGFPHSIWISLILFVITFIFEYIGYNIIRKHEEIEVIVKNENLEHEQKCKQEEIEQENTEVSNKHAK